MKTQPCHICKREAKFLIIDTSFALPFCESCEEAFAMGQEMSDALISPIESWEVGDEESLPARV